MKLLFITQKVDKEDDILGVYHEWIKRLAREAIKINVLCLYKGVIDLPSNVHIFSLGKESGVSKIKYTLNFYKYIFSLKNDYNLVFVHMNAIYVLLGWLFWKIWNKKIVFWNASYKISPLTKLSLFLSDRALTSVKEAFNMNSKKIFAVGQAIDTDLFQKDQIVVKEPNSLLFLGRISPVKNLEVLIEAIKILYYKKIDFKLTVVGSPFEKDQKYYATIRKKAETLENLGRIIFLERVPHYQTPRFYNQNKIFINLTESRSFDKSILEAMACESLVLVSNSVYNNIFDDFLKDKLIFREKDSEDLASKIEDLLRLSNGEVIQISLKLREIVVQNHNLNTLGPKLVSNFTSLIK